MKNQSLLLSLAAALFLALPACQPGGSAGDGEAATTDSTEVQDPRYDYSIDPGERVGLIELNRSSKAEVMEAYGDLAKADSVYLAEGMFGPGIMVFPEQDRNRLEIYWDEELDKDRPSFIRITGADGATDWATKEGITIGSKLSEVQAANGQAFELYGFGWDYGGYVSNWKGGQFNNNLGLRFEPPANAQVPADMLGETILSSDSEALQEIDPVVVEMSLSFPLSNLLPVMQGGWRSVSDEGYEIIIEGDQMRHYTNQRLSYTSTIEADPGCQSDACAVTGTAPEGFCFIEKGEFDAQCNLVLRADYDTLEYTAIGAAGGSLIFERVD